VTADGQIRRIVKAATEPVNDRPPDMLGLVCIIREVLRAEREEGYRAGYGDGQRDALDAARWEKERGDG